MKVVGDNSEMKKDEKYTIASGSGELIISKLLY